MVGMRKFTFILLRFRLHLDQPRNGVVMDAASRLCHSHAHCADTYALFRLVPRDGNIALILKHEFALLFLSE